MIHEHAVNTQQLPSLSVSGNGLVLLGNNENNGKSSLRATLKTKLFATASLPHNIDCDLTR